MPQDLLDTRARRLDAGLAFVNGRIGVEMQRLVDDREPVLIVQVALVGGDLGVDLDPELNIRLELRRPRQQILGHRHQGRQQAQA